MSYGCIVFLVDDDEAVRDALDFSLQQAGFVVESYDSGERFLDAYTGSRPGCLLMDLCMPGMDGLAVQQELIKRQLRIPIIFMSGNGTIRASVSAMKAGALDFLEKPFSRPLLLERIREALDQDCRIRASTEAQTEMNVHQAEAKSHYERLSPREKQIIALLTSGKSSKQVAQLLGISPRTVDVHRARLMAKMQASSMAELGAMFMLCVNLFHSAFQLNDEERATWDF
jgi:RNA polymerase sigma factor (sigma-70 family)